MAGGCQHKITTKFTVHLLMGLKLSATSCSVIVACIVTVACQHIGSLVPRLHWKRVQQKQWFKDLDSSIAVVRVHSCKQGRESWAFFPSFFFKLSPKVSLIFVQVKWDFLHADLFDGFSWSGLSEYYWETCIALSLSLHCAWLVYKKFFFFQISFNVSSDSHFICFLLFNTTLEIHCSATLNKI